MSESSKAQLDDDREVAHRLGYKDGVSAAISGALVRTAQAGHNRPDEEHWALGRPLC